MFHVVVSLTGRVLDVFAEHRLSAAQESARQLEAVAALPTRVEQARGRRPKVGEGFPCHPVARTPTSEDGASGTPLESPTPGAPVKCDICAGEPTRREGTRCFGCDRPSEMGS